MSDEEPVDPKKELEDRCKAPCTRPLKEYQVYPELLLVSSLFPRGQSRKPAKFMACAKRIQGDESGHKHCTGQYFDYWRCIDNCVATKLFTHLK